MAHESCDNCNHEYDFSPEVATLNLFINDPMCNFIMAVCPQCGVNTRIFLTGDAIVHIISECKLGFSLASDATDELKAAAKSLYGEPDEVAVQVETYELTDRQEQAISGFGSALEAIPDELFWDCINDDTDRPYPQDWT